MNMAATLRSGRLSFRDLGELAHQHIAIARVFAGKPRFRSYEILLFT
jgi:hypothetical protein